MTIIVVGDATDKHQAVNTCLSSVVMTVDNETVPILFSDDRQMHNDGHTVEGVFCTPLEAIYRLKTAFEIGRDKRLNLILRATFDSPDVERLLKMSRDRFEQMAESCQQMSLPDLLAHLDKMCIREDAIKTLRQPFVNAINTARYELQRLSGETKKGKLLVVDAEDLSAGERLNLPGGKSPFVDTTNQQNIRSRILSLKKTTNDLEMALKKTLNECFENFPLGCFLKCILVHGSFGHDVLCIPHGASDNGILHTLVAKAIIFCTLRPQASLGSIVHCLLPVLACVPIQQTPVCINFSCSATNDHEWRVCVRDSILSMMMSLHGMVNARLCALADRMFNAVMTREDFFSALSDVVPGGASLDIQLEPEPGGNHLSICPLPNSMTIIVNRVTDILQHLALSCTTKAPVGSEMFLVSILKALPTILVAVKSMSIDLVCDAVVCSLPDLQTRLPKPLQWKFAVCGDCTPLSLAVKIDKVVDRFLSSHNFKAAIMRHVVNSLSDSTLSSVQRCTHKVSCVVASALKCIFKDFKVQLAPWPLSLAFSSPTTTLDTTSAATQRSAARANSPINRFIKDLIAKTHTESQQVSTDSCAVVSSHVRERLLVFTPDGKNNWTVGTSANEALCALQSTNDIILAAIGVVERQGTSFYVPAGLFVIVFCDNDSVLNSLYDRGYVYCVIPRNWTVRQCMSSLCKAYELSYWLRMPLMPPDSLFYETISPPSCPLRRLPLQTPYNAIKQMALLLERVGSRCDGVLFGDHLCPTFVVDEHALFGMINASTCSNIFVTSHFNFQ